MPPALESHLQASRSLLGTGLHSAHLPPLEPCKGLFPPTSHCGSDAPPRPSTPAPQQDGLGVEVGKMLTQHALGRGKSPGQVLPV